MKTIKLPTIKVPTLRSLRQVVLTVGSLAAGCAAVFDGLGRAWGLGAVCVAGLVLNWLATDSPPPDRSAR